MDTLLRNALADPRGLNGTVSVDDTTLAAIVNMADGDARVALNTLEMCAAVARTSAAGGEAIVDGATLKTVLQRTHLSYSDGENSFVTTRNSDSVKFEQAVTDIQSNGRVAF